MKPGYSKHQSFFKKSSILLLFLAPIVPTSAFAKKTLTKLRPDYLKDFISDGLEGVDLALKAALEAKVSDPRISLKALESTSRKSAPVALSSRTYQLMVGDIPVCNKELRLHRLPHFENLILMGDIPEINSIEDTDTWPAWSATKTILSQALSSEGFRDARQGIITAKDRCYYLREGELTPVWKIEATVSGLPYVLIANEQVNFAFYKSYFDVDGTATIYPNNPYDPEMSTFKLRDLDDSGALENEFFHTTTTGTKAYSADHVFSYSSTSNATTKVTDDGRFDETSLFVNANRQYEWFKSLGYQWPEDQEKLLIVVHATYQGSSNFANYVYQGKNTPPTINVGDGNGIGLQNLPKDFDAVAHEFGHHVIYQTITDLGNSESLTLHEGLADYFVFANTGNACLCESVCTKYNGVACTIANECLRTGENSYVYGKDVSERTEVHERAQFVSAMLWDIRQDFDNAEAFDQLVYNAVMLMQKSSGYHDLVLALMLAEKELTGGENCSKIYDGAISRGLEKFITEFTCDNVSTTNFSGQVSSSKKAKSKSKLPHCGTVGVRSTLAGLFSFIFFMLPLAICFRQFRVAEVDL